MTMSTAASKRGLWVPLCVNQEATSPSSFTVLHARCSSQPTPPSLAHSCCLLKGRLEFPSEWREKNNSYSVNFSPCERDSKRERVNSKSEKRAKKKKKKSHLTRVMIYGGGRGSVRDVMMSDLYLHYCGKLPCFRAPALKIFSKGA